MVCVGNGNLRLTSQIGTADNGCAVLLAHPAQVRHWACHNDVSEELLPYTTESGVSNRPNRDGAAGVVVHCPHGFLGGGGGKNLNVIPFVARHTTR